MKKEYIRFHLICIKTGETAYIIDHARIIVWLNDNYNSSQEINYNEYVEKCKQLGISYAKNFAAKALRESLKAGADIYMDATVTDPLAGE